MGAQPGISPRESVPQQTILPGFPKGKQEGTAFPWRQTASGAARGLRASHFAL